MQCYSELIPPSGITHSLNAAFTSEDASNLIVVRTSLLQVFRHKQINYGLDTKLVLVAEFSLSGTVTALSKVKLLKSNSGGDALLVAFRDAKLSLVEWDPAHYSISTISIHYYENHDLLLCPWVPDLRHCISRLTADPSSRCAAFNFGTNNLAVIPFHQLGDELALDGFDDMDDEKQNGATTDANGEVDHKTPYAPSFVLPMTALDPYLLHPVDLAFLHEYREPTVGILYSTLAPSNNMAFARKDVMIYAVYTLDIEQRASTNLLSIPKLPNDLYKLIALPLPVGGALLIGGNEIMHIDQGGKVNAVGVNEYARECSAYPMVDQSELRLRLEGCQIETLGTPSGDMLLVLSSGDMAVLSFRIDGRSISGLSLRPLTFNDAPRPVLTRASDLTYIGLGRIFVASEESDSVLLGTLKKAAQLKRHSSRGQNGMDDLENAEDEVDDDDDDDDLYGDSNGLDGYMEQSLTGGQVRTLDRLISIGPINDFTFGRPAKRKRQEEDEKEGEIIESGDDVAPDLELALACCRGSAGALALLQREVSPRTIKRIKYEDISGAWSFSTKASYDPESESTFDDTLILSIMPKNGPVRSRLMTLEEGQLEERENTDFDGNTTTIAVGSLTATNHTVQVAANDIRVYDEDFGLSQIFPIVDEDDGNTAQVVAAIVIDPFVLFLRDDQTIGILKADDNGELDVFEIPDNVPSKEVTWACIYDDATDFFGTSAYTTKSISGSTVILCVLTTHGTFSLYPLANPQLQIFQYHGLTFLPPLLSPDTPIPKHWKNADEIAEVLLLDLGDAHHQSPCLLVRNTTGDIIVYEAFALSGVEGSFRFRKSVTKNADATEEDEYSQTSVEVHQAVQRLLPLPSVGGYRAAGVAGRSPAVVLKSASAAPKIHRLRTGPVKHFSSLNGSTAQNSLVYVDFNSRLTIAQLPPNTDYSLSDWSIRKIPFGEEITSLAYHAPTSTYLLSTAQPTPFQLPQDDEWHPEWATETTTFLPTTTMSTLKLISSSTYHTISQYSFDTNEHILALQSLPLETSEETHEQQELVAIGTAVTKGENAVTRGNIHILSIAQVNPDPDRPFETDLKLKLITKEDVRGSVSAITSIGSQGFLLASQGQKAMVRGLKEDRTLLPVAFLDMGFHVSVAKELPGTGLTILGDAFSGLWLMGYGEEPYKMQLLARDLENPNVVAADFLPDARQLFIISSNDDGEMRVIEYDPENPKTERGTKLLLRSSFNTGSYQTKIALVPRTPTSSEALAIATARASLRRQHRRNQRRRRRNAKQADDSDGDDEKSAAGSNAADSSDGDDSDDPDAMDLDLNNLAISGGTGSGPTYKTNQVLLTSQTGAISLLTPLSETSYRRLSTLQNILTTQLDQPLGLNPRAYRAVETDGIGGRAIIDGNIIRRWLGMGSWHKGVTSGKVGGSVWDVRADLEAVGGVGLGYL